jgi:uncharacterized membrane protein YraQ (UPF0718 family)
MSVVQGIGHALGIAGSMTWAILWALILGFGLSAVVQAVVRKDEISRLLPDDRPRTLAVASGLGAASSSCSYASVALARSLFRKGANFTAAMAFEIASTNLVIELGIKFSIPSPAEIPCRIGHPKRRLTFQATAGDTSQHPHL